MTDLAPCESTLDGFAPTLELRDVARDGGEVVLEGGQERREVGKERRARLRSVERSALCLLLRTTMKTHLDLLIELDEVPCAVEDCQHDRKASALRSSQRFSSRDCRRTESVLCPLLTSLLGPRVGEDNANVGAQRLDFRRERGVFWSEDRVSVDSLIGKEGVTVCIGLGERGE